jgi:RNA polymerase sigma-70 factor, ECF subfamily
MIGPVAKAAGLAPLTPEGTAALVERARRGEAEAVTALVRSFMRPAYSVALAIVGRAADAEDVAQESLVTAFERLNTCREPASFGPWLLQIVRNRSRNLLDWRLLHDTRTDPNEAAEPTIDAQPDQGLRESLLGALAHLSPVQREIVLLHDLEGWSHAEIAAAVDVSEVMSRQHLFQARRALRERLDHEE